MCGSVANALYIQSVGHGIEHRKKNLNILCRSDLI